MYKLYCTRMDNKEPVILQYDAKTSILLDENGEDLGEKLKAKLKQMKDNGANLPVFNTNTDFKPVEAFKLNPENPIGKSSDVRILKISMGLKCNYSCSYCSQSMHIEDAEDTNIVDSYEFLSKLDSWLTSAPERIEFWGGEPFVYWKKIQVIVPELRKKYPSAKFVIITNGALLNQEILDFIIDNDISITISHDGPGQPLRGPDPLEDEEIKKIWLSLFEQRKGDVSINSVLTAKNNDPAAIRRWFYERLGGDVVILGLEGVVNAHDGAPDAEFTEEDYAELEKNVFFALWNGEPPSSSLWRRTIQFLNSLVNKNNSDFLWQKCGMDQTDQLAIDLLGNVSTCQNTGSKGKHGIGTVFDLENVKLDTSWHWSQRNECSHCPMLQLCQGSCMFLDGNDWAHTCNNEYHYAKPIFNFVLAAFFGYIVLDIRGDIRRPKIKKTIPLVAATI